jgi:hypothetical protein
LSKISEVEFEGQMVPAEELEFESQKEPWCIYQLEDGTVFKMKLNLVSIFKLIGRFGPTGEPIYAFKIAGINHADVPASLKKKAEST